MNDNDQELNSIQKRLYILESQGIPGVRDFFATSALSILANVPAEMTGNYSFPIPSQVAKFAYEIADAMLKERSKDVS